MLYKVMVVVETNPGRFYNEKYIEEYDGVMYDTREEAEQVRDFAQNEDPNVTDSRYITEVFVKEVFDDCDDVL